MPSPLPPLSLLPFLWPHRLQMKVLTLRRPRPRSPAAGCGSPCLCETLPVPSPAHCRARSPVSGLDTCNHSPPTLGGFRALRHDAALPIHALCPPVYVPILLPFRWDLPWGPSQLGTVKLAWGQFHIRGRCKSPTEGSCPSQRRVSRSSPSPRSQKAWLGPHPHPR